MRAPYSGHCLCGAIRFQVNSEPLTFYAGHCTDCQRRTGTAFALSLIEPREWGEPKRHSDIGVVQSGALEQPLGLTLVAHIFTSSAQPWVVFPEDAVLFPGSQKIPWHSSVCRAIGNTSRNSQGQPEPTLNRSANAGSPVVVARLAPR
jgi:hypothetical protein